MGSCSRVRNNDGRRVVFRAAVSDVGGPSRLFESRPTRVPALKNGWELYRVDAVCIGN